NLTNKILYIRKRFLFLSFIYILCVFKSFLLKNIYFLLYDTIFSNTPRLLFYQIS
ncbi:hypothetical protein AAJ76_2320003, partial [Vairimorpha ceranae]